MNYTHETLSEKMATEVMGWVKAQRGRLHEYWYDQSELGTEYPIGKYLVDYHNGYHPSETWHPSRPEGVAQALECLEKYTGDSTNDVANAYIWYMMCAIDLKIENDIDLATAICLALASALDSEQATLKE